MVFCMIFFMIHKISCYKVRVSTGVVETRWLSGSFLKVYRNNTVRQGSGFIGVSLETRWLGHKSGFYVPERPCKLSQLLFCHSLNVSGVSLFCSIPRIITSSCVHIWVLITVLSRAHRASSKATRLVLTDY